MAGKPSLVEEVGDGIRTIFSRLGEFFHIFDLSFFVAGASTVGALAVLSWRLKVTQKISISISGWLGVLSFIIACYICGLVVFSLGRSLNRKMFRQKVIKTYLSEALIGQQLRGEVIDEFKEGKAPPEFPQWRLYIRLWQELAARHSQSVAFSHLSRYWAMAATYDGVAASFLVWVVAIIPLKAFGQLVLDPWPGWVAVAALIGASLQCFRQGGKYYEFQVEDLVAALAVMRKDES